MKILLSRVSNFIKTENRMVVAEEYGRDRGKGGKDSGGKGEPVLPVLEGNRIPVWGEGKFWGWMVVMVVQQCKCT